MLTYLAIVFVLILIAAIFYGFGIIMRRAPSQSELNSETCSLCRKKYSRSSLVERVVGDSRVFYFCPSCIKGLQNDAGRMAAASQELKGSPET
ncbi:MAG: hypothetical protein A2X67_09240 [Ignavibacteria bacterium GWA2_55_11]|nr:MAG: hypothetical protein A2X67_09240 [Ignavibacteria bacterium GWA2_55_11]OGU62130.1 MAG: hypothetical protein A3C56_03075 [Ignavibacteria bacterium RIFCSPHIGHO2_02_FULL_56_12]OGU70618.1 MAG: hypothetical protein A3H45_02955 [Ignavibacteria bacterium RIFCSPLOWO2_02_FULL_55_14]OGU73373.1 MAG: hypothetical protein A3G43_04790 [Ignavibacteria bacterium RIFCSPLOWO2_12_FULL_56_21]